MKLTYSVTKSAYKYRKSDRLYKSCLHGQHKCNNHAKYNSFTWFSYSCKRTIILLFNHVAEWAQFSQAHRRKRKPDLKISMKILFHDPPISSLSFNRKILKAFLKTFPTKMKPIKCPTREKKKRQEKRREMLLSTHARTSLIFCIWIRRPQSVRPLTGFVVSFKQTWLEANPMTAG